MSITVVRYLTTLHWSALAFKEFPAQKVTVVSMTLPTAALQQTALVSVLRSQNVQVFLAFSALMAWYVLMTLLTAALQQTASGSV
jgi:hypothetical protein